MSNTSFTKYAGLVILCAFLVPIVAHAWDPIKDLTGKRLDEHLDHAGGELSNAPESWTRCLSNPGGCAEQTLKRIPYQSVSPIIERYKQDLYNQASGRWKSLPRDFVEAAQDHYPEIALNSIRYATDINTWHGQALTWHYHIFFPRDINLDTYQDVEWMLHEIEHVVQYERRGGEREFLGEYVLKTVGKVIQQGNFNVHDYVDIEEAATRKADRLKDAVYDQSRGRPFLFVNKCSEPIRLVLEYLDFRETWKMDGWWKIDPGKKAFLQTSNGEPLRFTNSIIYFYAKSDSWVWSGQRHEDFNDQILPMREQKLKPDGADDWTLPVSCE